jgi:hypothetical protein
MTVAVPLWYLLASNSQVSCNLLKKIPHPISVIVGDGEHVDVLSPKDEIVE